MNTISKSTFFLFRPSVKAYQTVARKFCDENTALISASHRHFCWTPSHVSKKQNGHHSSKLSELQVWTCNNNFFSRTSTVSINLSRGIHNGPNFCTRRHRSTAVTDEEDDEPSSDEPFCIYEGVLTSQLKRLKFFSLTSSAIGLALQPQIILNSGGTSIWATGGLLAIISFFTYGTPFLIHLLCKRYVTEIIFDPKTEVYTAVVFNLFMQRREIAFKPKDVIIPDAPGPFTAILVKIKDKNPHPLFFTQNMFKNPVHYGKIMGYDRPIDLHLSSPGTEPDTKASEPTSSQTAGSKYSKTEQS